MDPALLADSVLRPQLGVGTRTQLRAAGLVDRTISRLVDRGELTHEHRGVYGLSGWPSTALRVAYAGQLAAPSPLAAAASTTALEIQGIEVVRYSAEECLPTEILDPSIRQRRTRTGLVLHPGRLPDVMVSGPVRACAVLAALGQALQWGDRLRAVWACEHALRNGTVDFSDLAAHVAGLPAVARTRFALVDVRSESPLETWGRIEAMDAGLPPLTPQIPVRIGGRTLRVDLGIEELRIGWEADGRTYHPLDGPTYFADRRRERQLRALGWEIHRFCWSDLLLFRERTIAEMRAAITLRRTRSA